MGYTEIFVNFEIDSKIVPIIQFMIDDNNPKPELPDHKFFRLIPSHNPHLSYVWETLLRGGSPYHIPESTVQLFYELDGWYLTGRSDGKDYCNSIELFFDWINPYINGKLDGEFIGYSRYEDDLEPTLYFKKP